METVKTRLPMNLDSLAVNVGKSCCVGAHVESLLLVDTYFSDGIRIHSNRAAVFLNRATVRSFPSTSIMW